MTDTPTDEELELGLEAFEHLESKIDQLRGDLKEQRASNKDALEASRVIQEVQKTVLEVRRFDLRQMVTVGLLSGVASGITVSFFCILAFR